ncbi:MAG: hypothetical protein AAF264_02570 [Pseudomonadota bacterium]
MDSCLEGCTLEVRAVRSPIGPLAHIATQSPDITIDDDPIGADGIWERLPCRVVAAGVPVTLAAPPRGTDRAAARILGVAAFVVALGAVGLGLWRTFAPKPRLAAPMASIPTPTAPAPIGLTAFEDALREAGLGDDISGRSDGERTLVVAGSLAEERHGDWLALRRGWDARTNTVPISGRVDRMPALARLPPIAAVRLGDDPYVLLASDRSRVRPGEMLADGWVLRAVHADGLVLARGPDEARVSF